MNIYQNQSLFSLWLATFGLVNRSLGMLLKALLLLWGVPLAIMGGLAYLLATRAPIILLILGIIFGIYVFVLSLATPVILYRLINGEVENIKESLSEAVLNSLVPAFYTIVYSLGLGILNMMISAAGAWMDSKVIMGLLSLAFFFCITLRVIFTPMAIAVRDMGPIQAVSHSWQLTSGAGYWRALGMCFWSAVIPFLSVLGLIGLMAAAYVCIPLYFPSFDITHLTWHTYLILALLALVGVFLGLCMFVFPFLVFLNMDNVFHQHEWHEAESLAAANAAPPLKVAKAATHNDYPSTFDYNAPLPQAQADDDGVEDLTVQRTAVQNDEKTDTLSEHLKQVYNPAHADVIEYTEEDRMPTIMFDDHMAQQLEENRKMWNDKSAPKKDSAEKDDGMEGTIKMSR